MTGLSRRAFLTLAWKSLAALAGLLGLGGLARFLGHQPEPPRPTHFDLGPASDYPLGARTILPEAEAILLHTVQGYMAISLVCPHLGCIVDSTDEGFTCPCHASRFGADGSLLRGPADKPLRWLRLEATTEGHLILHTD